MPDDRRPVIPRRHGDHVLDVLRPGSRPPGVPLSFDPASLDRPTIHRASDRRSRARADLVLALRGIGFGDDQAEIEADRLTAMTEGS